jgi:hypothetical protein
LAQKIHKRKKPLAVCQQAAFSLRVVGWGQLKEPWKPAWNLTFHILIPLLFPHLFPHFLSHTFAIKIRRRQQAAGSIET